MELIVKVRTPELEIYKVSSLVSPSTTPPKLNRESDTTIDPEKAAFRRPGDPRSPSPYSVTAVVQLVPTELSY